MTAKVNAGCRPHARSNTTAHQHLCKTLHRYIFHNLQSQRSIHIHTPTELLESCWVGLIRTGAHLKSVLLEVPLEGTAQKLSSHLFAPCKMPKTLHTVPFS